MFITFSHPPHSCLRRFGSQLFLGAWKSCPRIRDHIPAQGLQDARRQKKDLARNDRHALNMAAFRIPCLLREPHPAERRECDGEPRYIIRASFSQERMQYLADEGTVIYSAKGGKDRKVFDAPEWLAAMCSHVPNRGEQMVRYYGYYSNVSRGKRQEKTADDTIPHIIESDKCSKAYRKSWARLIQKIYEVDPLICPKTIWGSNLHSLHFCSIRLRKASRFLSSKSRTRNRLRSWLTDV